MNDETRKTGSVILFLVLVVLAGCAQVSIHSTVNADGTIEEYRMEINTSRTVYGYIEQSAEDQGYDSVRESFLADIDETQAEEIEYDEEFRGDEVTITVIMTGLDPSENDDISITRGDDTITYEDTTFVNETAQDTEESNITQAISSGFAVDYYLTMPGDITNSNADEVDDNKAEWHETGSDAFTDTRIYAESKVPSGPALPGFGFVTALMALIMMVVFLSRRY